MIDTTEKLAVFASDRAVEWLATNLSNVSISFLAKADVNDLSDLRARIVDFSSNPKSETPVAGSVAHVARAIDLHDADNSQFQHGKETFRKMRDKMLNHVGDLVAYQSRLDDARRSIELYALLGADSGHTKEQVEFEIQFAEAPVRDAMRLTHQPQAIEAYDTKFRTVMKSSLAFECYSVVTEQHEKTHVGPRSGNPSLKRIDEATKSQIVDRAAVLSRLEEYQPKRSKGSISQALCDTLSDEFGVSPSTVRRELKKTKGEWTNSQ